MMTLLLAAAVTTVSGETNAIKQNISLAPGFKMSCTVSFDAMPKGRNMLVTKDREYLLRCDVAEDGVTGDFRFWPYVNGKWEPSVGHAVQIEPGRKYAIAAAWDGAEEMVCVDGVTNRLPRFGTYKSTADPLTITSRAGTKVTNLVIRSTHEPNPFFTGVRSVGLMLHVGEPMPFRAEVFNVGGTLRDAKIVAKAQRGSLVEPVETAVSEVAEGATVPFSWWIDPGTNESPWVQLALWHQGRKLCEKFVDLVQMPKCDPDMSAAKWNPPIHATRTYHVDARRGDDARDGLTPETAWKGFANTKGLVLGPGERLLIRRGSVIDEELVITAKGAADNWAEIGAYGEGPRPTIRRTRDIDERCAFVLNPAYLAIRDLIVCNAGKGFIVECGASGSGYVLMERCLAHHIEGLYRFNSHGIPEWRDRKGAPGGQKGALVLCGMWANHMVMRDCEMYQCSNGFAGLGSYVWFGRLLCHDNYCRNTSSHPFFTATRRAWIIDSIFDAAGWNAAGGTMGIMLADNDGLVVRGCHFINMADSGSGDAGGIDFECYGNNCLVEECTFRNNAGAAIEVLGFSTVQAHNTHIRNCRFDRNNWAHKAGPSEILIDGTTTGPNRSDRRIWSSNGFIENNGYVLVPGVMFFTNKSDLTQADWKFAGNVQYPDWTSLRQAMPFDDPPEIAAEAEIWTDASDAVLAAEIRADRPTTVAWEQLEGPEIVAFATADEPRTPVTLPTVGDYRFLVKADDGRYWRTARTAVHRLPPGERAVRAWSFAKNLDAEGWTFDGLGTVRETFTKPSSYADPVHHVVGDYFVLAMKNATAATLLSADGLAADAGPDAALLVRMQNHTDSAAMRVWWTTDSAPDWTDANARTFAVNPSEKGDTLYRVPLGTVGQLRRLRLDFSADAKPVTGTVRIDYICLTSQSQRKEK